MKKSKYYHNVKFSARVIEEAHDLFLSQLDTTKEIRKPTTMEVTIGNEIWNFDTRQEFLSEYLKADDCMFSHSVQECGLRIYLESDEKYTSVTVEFLERSKIESIFQVF